MNDECRIKFIIQRSSFTVVRSVVLRLATDFFALFEFAHFAFFDFATAVGMLVADSVAGLAIECFEWCGIEGLEANCVNHGWKFSSKTTFYELLFANRLRTLLFSWRINL